MSVSDRDKMDSSLSQIFGKQYKLLTKRKKLYNENINLYKSIKPPQNIYLNNFLKWLNNLIKIFQQIKLK